MMLKETLRAVVKSQREELKLYDPGVEREDVAGIVHETPFALVLSGVRRCGKSTLMRQLMSRTSGYYYFNFEDPRAVDFEVSDYRKLDEVFKEEYGSQIYYFFDEIQNVDRWELFVRSTLDRKKHVTLTGSNASLLSRELGTRLTGRHLRHELFPFTYKEFLKLKNLEAGAKSFHEYLLKGGFPEYLKIGRTEILQELLNDIVVRDIAVRHNIRNVKTLKEMVVYLLTNAGKSYTYNSLKKTFDMGSTNSAISYVSYFEDSYLLFTVSKYDPSLKRQIVNPKKIYSIDNGMTRANTASLTEDMGRMLENAVYISLRRKHKDIYYFQGRNECDFLVREGGKVAQALQACYSLDEDNKDREINGIREAMEKYGLKRGRIITYDQEDELAVDGKTIKVTPAWKWVMGEKKS